MFTKLVNILNYDITDTGDLTQIYLDGCKKYNINWLRYRIKLAITLYTFRRSYLIIFL